MKKVIITLFAIVFFGKLLFSCPAASQVRVFPFGSIMHKNRLGIIALSIQQGRGGNMGGHKGGLFWVGTPELVVVFPDQERALLKRYKKFKGYEGSYVKAMMPFYKQAYRDAKGYTSFKPLLPMTHFYCSYQRKYGAFSMRVSAKKFMFDYKQGNKIKTRTIRNPGGSALMYTISSYRVFSIKGRTFVVVCVAFDHDLRLDMDKARSSKYVKKLCNTITSCLYEEGPPWHGRTVDYVLFF